MQTEGYTCGIRCCAAIELLYKNQKPLQSCGFLMNEEAAESYRWIIKDMVVKAGQL